jgi:hypothetical protein
MSADREEAAKRVAIAAAKRITQKVLLGIPDIAISGVSLIIGVTREAGMEGTPIHGIFHPLRKRKTGST